jgi:integrase
LPVEAARWSALAFDTLDRVGELVQVGADGIEESHNRAPADVALADLKARDIGVARPGLCRDFSLREASAGSQVPESAGFASPGERGRNERRFKPATQEDYRWRLERHLLPYFAEMPLDAIIFDAVERYIGAKLDTTQPLSPRSINMTVTLLGAILESAVERELITRNPAQISGLLGAAGELDRAARPACRHIERRAMLATLTFAGLRIGELCALRWRDVDLAAGWLHVGESKTDAGRRRVKLRGALLDELVAVRARRPQAPSEGYVFPTLTGGRQSPDNLRSRVLKVAVERANENSAKQGLPPLPESITPHSLRRTFASVLYALGEDPGVVMDEMGHTDPALALRVYRQSMRRGEHEKAQLRALIEGNELAVIGRRAAEAPSHATEHEAA